MYAQNCPLKELLRRKQTCTQNRIFVNMQFQVADEMAVRRCGSIYLHLQVRVFLWCAKTRQLIYTNQETGDSYFFLQNDVVI